MDAIAPSAGDPINLHVPCLGCGYDLFASKRGGLCPECGRDVTASVSMAGVLYAPGNVAVARGMSGLLLTSSIFAGLCPASCLLFLNLRNLFGAIAMSIAFVTCATTAGLAEQRRRRIVTDANKTDDYMEPLAADAIAACGLTAINIAAYLFALDQMWRTVCAICVGLGFFLLCTTAWRALPTWRAHAELARLMNAPRLEKFLKFLAWTKAIYETVWLACCWIPFACVALGGPFEDLMLGIAFGAMFGLIGFCVIWILMIIAHAILMMQIRRATSVFLTERPRH